MGFRPLHLFLATAVAGAILFGLLRLSTNDPYREGEAAEQTMFSSFYRPPTKHDPATSYFSHEGQIIDQIYEAPFGYHYLKRPYELVTRTAEEVPTPVYFDANGKQLPRDAPANQVARAEYVVRIKKGIFYQDHPCFAKDAQGEPLYRDVTAADLKEIESPNDFPIMGTRELVAADYIRQLRRMADPRLTSPVRSTFERNILGLTELRTALTATLEAERARRKEAAGAAYSQERDEKSSPIDMDLMAPELTGAEVLDSHSFKIVLKRKYPQILYWMAMHFFAPMPQEALDFYAQPALIEKQIVLNRWPVGTGAYRLGEFNPNRIITLERNPNYREDFYPSEGAPGDLEAGFLADAGKRIPFIDRYVMNLEKEAIPRWNKFLQGYYDTSGIAADVFEQTIQLSSSGEIDLSGEMAGKGIALSTAVNTSIFCFGFNMIDEVVGGYTPEKAKLRRAISVALDYNEYLEIFSNGRGISAQGPIPPGIFGHESGEKGVNPYVDEWDPARQRPTRRSIEYAKQLMTEAGYPGGRDADGHPLEIHIDHSSGGDPDFLAQFQWMRRKLERIGILLRERGTELSRFREKVDSGEWQVYRLGWLADYPDPENFLFLYYGPNAKVPHHGENNVNYKNAEYDAMFERVESMENGPERKALIDKMVDTLRRDAPWVWGYHPVDYMLHHAWYGNSKSHQMSYDTLKYRRLDPESRVARQQEWNKPRVWPVMAAFGLLVAVLAPGVVAVSRRERGR